MQQLLVDELTGDRVILAPARALRPDTFRVHAEPLPASVATCPFCRGNEHETPPEVARLGGGAPDTPGLDPAGRAEQVPHRRRRRSRARTRSSSSPPRTTPTRRARRRRRGRRRASRCATAPASISTNGCTYAQAFVNQGKPAGASIEHPHAQLIALDFVPPRAQARLDRFTATAFANDQQHRIADGDGRRLVPARIADTVHRAPRARATADAGSTRLRDDDARAVGIALRDAIATIRRALGEVPYNVMIETAPRDHDRSVPLVGRHRPAPRGGRGLRARDRPLGEHRGAGRRRRRHCWARECRSASAITIAASPDTVWRVVEPIERHVDWMADAESIRFTGTADPRCRYRVRLRHEGRSDPADRPHVGDRVGAGRYDGHRTPRRRHRPGPLHACEQQGRRTTRVHLERAPHVSVVDGRTASARSPRQPVLRAIWRRNLRRLKSIVEAT